MSAALKSGGIFRRLHQSERKKILQTLGALPTYLSVKGDGDLIYSLITESFSDDKILQCRAERASDYPKKDQAVVVNLSSGNEKYFFQGFLISTPGKIVIQVPDVMYILQRRKSVRMDIPEKYPATFIVIQMNAKTVFHEMRILDFSSGGVRVFFPDEKTSLAVGQKFLGVLHLSSRRPLQLEATIRHIVKKEINGISGQQFGIQFENLDKILETKLLTTFMDVQREIFIKNYK